AVNLKHRRVEAGKGPGRSPVHGDEELDAPLAAVDLLLLLLLRQDIALHRDLTGGEGQPGEGGADHDVLAPGELELPLLGKLVLPDRGDTGVDRLADSVCRQVSDERRHRSGSAQEEKGREGESGARCTPPPSSSRPTTPTAHSQSFRLKTTNAPAESP